MSTSTVDACGLCGSDNLRTVLSLGESPPTCAMTPVGETPSEESYPLDLLYCEDCGLVQLSVVVDPKVVFPSDYPYSSGNSKALRENFEDLAAQTETCFEDGLAAADLVVDIGANDGTLLRNFECRTVGVEPTMQALGITGATVEGFFSEAAARYIREVFGPAKVITACNVLAHVEDVHDVMRGINHLLADDGVLVAENHDFGSVINGQWDTVYHEHLRFFDRSSFNALLGRYGFGATGGRDVPTHGGSFRVIAQKTGLALSMLRPHYDFAKLAEGAARSRTEIRQAAVGGLWGIGATARATTIINYCGLDVEDIECVCEVSGSDKIGRYIPGTRIPVIDEDALFEQQPAKVMLFSWHLSDLIVPKLRERGYEGEIIVPLPEVRSL